MSLTIRKFAVVGHGQLVLILTPKREMLLNLQPAYSAFSSAPDPSFATTFIKNGVQI